MVEPTAPGRLTREGRDGQETGDNDRYPQAMPIESDATIPHEVWLVRHAETDSNRDGLVQGHSDIPLNQTGIRQAERLATDLVSRADFGSLVTSPLSRAQSTATIVGQGIGLVPQEDARFTEVAYGDWEGHPRDEVRARRRSLGAEPFTVAPPGGESAHAMAQRVLAAFDDWANRPITAPRLLVVTHGGPITALVCWTLGLSHSLEHSLRIRRDNASVTVLRRSPETGTGFQIEGLNRLY